MNTKALFLFLILLFGLILCSFLGGKCNKEGFDITDKKSTSNKQNSSANAVTSNYDNYNHYSGNGSSIQLQNGSVFTDVSGNTITVITNSDGSQSLQLKQIGQNTPMVLSSTSSGTSSAPNTFYAPYGNMNATVITGTDGQTAIQFNLPNGQTVIFTQSGTNSNSNSNMTSTQYYGSTGTPIQQSEYALAYQGPNGGNVAAISGPKGNSAFYAQGPNGNAVAGISTNNLNPYYNGTSSTQYYGPYGGTPGAVEAPASGYGDQYYSTMPQGIPSSQIPKGQEDLYILKSEIVPPVCPACPSSSACPRQEPAPPCPACARCPEPSFECKKVPNYNAINSDYLPTPVLNDFSQFGM